MDEPSMYAAQVHDLASQACAEGVVFQSVAVAAMQTIEQVLRHEKAAASAAISLGQREKLQEMVGTLQETFEALRASLSAQGARMLDLAGAPDARALEKSWWFALTETIEALEEGTARMLSIVSGQERGGPARKLSNVVVRLLRNHEQALLAEAEAWIS